MRILLIGVNPNAEQNLAIPILLQCVKQKLQKRSTTIQIEAMYFDCLRSRFSRHFKNSLTSIYLTKPDVIGFSCYCWNIEIILDYCQSLKRLIPDVQIVLGGPQVSYNPNKTMKEYSEIDFIVTGEGEETFPELLSCLALGHKDFAGIEGLCYRHSTEVTRNPSRPGADLDMLPSPFTGGAYNTDAPDFSITYETMRGCPYSCIYCMYSKGERRPRYYSLDRIKNDLEVILLSSQVKYIWMADPIFNLDEQRALRILDIIDKYNERGIQFGFEFRAEILSEEFIRNLPRYSKFIYLIAVGLQTVNTKSLRNLNRTWDRKRFERNIRLIKRHLGNEVYLNVDLIYGIPGDTIEDYKRSINYTLGLGCAAAVQPLHVLPGTKLHRLRARFKIEALPHTPFSVLRSCTFTSEDLIKAEQVNVGLNFYQFHNSFKKVIDKILSATDQSPAELFEALGSHLWQSGKVEYFDNDFLLSPEKITQDFIAFLESVMLPADVAETCCSELERWATRYSEYVQFHYDAIRPEPLSFEEQSMSYNIRRREALRVF